MSLLLHKVGFKLRWEPDLVDGHRRHADWIAQKCVGVCVLLAGAMFYVEVVLSKALDPPSHLTPLLFEGFQPLQSAVDGSYLKFSAVNVAADVAQRFDEREHFLASHCVFPLWLRQCTAEVGQRLFDSGSDYLRQYAADAEVACIAVHNKWLSEVRIGKRYRVFERGRYCLERTLAVGRPVQLALFL